MAVEILERYTEYAAADVGATDREAWSINDDNAANWALRRIKQIERSIAKRKEFVDREIASLKAWLEEENERDIRDIQFFTSHLEAYFRRLQNEGTLGKRKSYTLPNGTLQMRAAQPKFERDDSRLLEWAVATGDDTLIKTKVEPAWGEIRKKLRVLDNGVVVHAETGEVVPGVTAVVEGDVFSVKTSD